MTNRAQESSAALLRPLGPKRNGADALDGDSSRDEASSSGLKRQRTYMATLVSFET